MSALVRTSTQVDVPVSEPEYVPTGTDWDALYAWDAHDAATRTDLDSPAPRKPWGMR